MTKDIYDVVVKYVLKNPDLNYSEIADLIIDDNITEYSHRTLRRYVAETNEAIKDLPASTDLDTFIDINSAGVDFSGITAEDINDAMTNLDVPEAVDKVRKPKILFLDIETARMIVGVWDIGYKVNIGPQQIIKDWFIYGWAGRWFGESDTVSAFVTPEEAIARDDKRIMTELWQVMETADIIVTHNGNKFDIPKIKTRFILNQLPPLSSFRSVDTYRVVSKEFAFASNALNYIGQRLAEKEKIATTYSLWIECEKGVAEALDFMHKYCIGDIDVLEAVYVMLRPWMKSHPNLAVFMDAITPVCPNCGSEDVHSIESIYTTQQNAFPEVVCYTCGATNRTKDSLISSAKRKTMVIPSAH